MNRRFDLEDGITAGIIGTGCLILLLNVAWISVLIWAVVRLVQHFT